MRRDSDSTYVVGVDIGGANLKLADAQGVSVACRFPLWTDSSQLGSRLQELLEQQAALSGRPASELAITMTGEMADCFATRREGVQRIVAQVGEVGLPLVIYAVGGQWLSATEACQRAWDVAASNWHALGSWLCRLPQLAEATPNLLVDIGSTTTDIIPLADGGVATAARTDRQRLQAGQLVYTGLERTPVAAIVSRLQIGGESCPVVAEKFATSDDAYLLLGLTAEQPQDCGSADGRSRTREHACGRLARMIGEDAERLPPGSIQELARQVIAAQARQIADAILRNRQSWGQSGMPRIVASGHGRPLAEQVQRQLPVASQWSYLEQLISPEAARAGPAVAVAWLRSQDDRQAAR